MSGRSGPGQIGGGPDVAVALSYDGDGAPRVTASGRHRVADDIVAAAEAAGVPLYPDAELALVLAQIPVGDEIPEALYRAIAEVIAFAYLVAGKFPEGFVPPDADA
jgi:flagellar biosynthesis protein